MLDRIDTATIPTPINLGNQPFSFVIQAKNAKTGEQNANESINIHKQRIFFIFTKQLRYED